MKSENLQNRGNGCWGVFGDEKKSALQGSPSARPEGGPAPSPGGRTGNAEALAYGLSYRPYRTAPGTRKEYTRIEIWANDTRIRRSASGNVVVAGQGKRGRITGFSYKASARCRFAVSNTPELSSPGALLITLTYPSVYPKDMREVKRHLHTLGKRCRRLGAYFAWVLEYQDRGAPHYHLVARFPQTMCLKEVQKWVARNWYEVVGSADNSHRLAGTRTELVKTPETCSWYLSKYLTKEYQKVVPVDVVNPGRMWGMVGIKVPKPKVLTFLRDDVAKNPVIRGLRRWVTSEHAFRQRVEVLSWKDRAKMIRQAVHNEDFSYASYLGWNGKGNRVFMEGKPILFDRPVKNRTAFHIRDRGEWMYRGFSVRNGSKVARLLVQVYGLSEKGVFREPIFKCA